MKEQKSMMLFEATIKSKATLRTYQIHLRRLLEYSKIKDYDSLITLKPKQIQDLLEDYLLFLRKKLSGNSIPSIFSCYQSFFSYHVDGVNFKRIKRMFPAKEIQSGREAYTAEQVRSLIDNTISLKIKAIIHFMASSGVRVGALHELRLKHIEDMPNECKSVLVYADTISEYTTFITSECFQAIEDYLRYRKRKGELITKDSFVFVKPNGQQHDDKDLSISLCRLSTSKLDRKKSGVRYTVSSSHGLRKRFNTILKMSKEINISIAEKLLGHSSSVQLDNVYFTPSKEQLFNEYQKAIPDLLLDEKYQLKIKIEELESDKDNRILQLENKLDLLQEFLKTSS